MTFITLVKQYVSFGWTFKNAIKRAWKVSRNK
jgi:hypothetical protein